MIRSLGVTVPRAPGDGRKDHDKKQEKDAGDFEPQDSAHPAKRTQESSHAASHPAGRASCRLAGGAPPGSRIRSSGPPRVGNGRRRRVRLCLGAACDFLPDNAPRYAQSDAQGAANGVWLHSLLKW